MELPIITTILDLSRFDPDSLTPLWRSLPSPLQPVFHLPVAKEMKLHIAIPHKGSSVADED